MLLRFFGDLHVDFRGSYRTRLPDRMVECVAKYLDRAGDVILADALRHTYDRLQRVFYSKPVDYNSFVLAHEERQRLAAMTDEQPRSAFERLLRIESLRRLGSEKELQEALLAEAGEMVRLLKDVRSGKKKTSRTRVPRAEANIRARQALKGRPTGGRRWSMRTLAKAIGCSPSQTANLPAWVAYAEEHGLKRKKANAAPKAVGLTDAVLANEGREDTELQRLIDEQRNDDEGSPVEPARPKHRRRRRKA